MSTTISKESQERVRALAARAGMRAFTEEELGGLLRRLCSALDVYTINGRNPHPFEFHGDVKRVFGIDVSSRDLKPRKFTDWLRLSRWR